jgi:putative aldouronate transport system substrate-binding protein
VFFTDKEEDELSIIRNDIKSFVTQQFSRFVIVGKVDEGWDQYTKQLTKMGLDRYLQLHQVALDRYNR